MNLTGIHKDVGLIPGLAQWVAMSCGVGRQLQPQFHPLVWEPPCAAGGAKKKKNPGGLWRVVSRGCGGEVIGICSTNR